MQDAILSELALQVEILGQELRSIKIPKPETPVTETKHYFNPTKELVYVSPTGITDWADSGSAEFIPATAKEAIVMAWVEDTDGGAGRTVVEAQGGGIIRTIASLYETVDTTADSAGGGDVFVPVSGGRFDWRLSTLAAGAAQVNIRIELVGYVS